jgi:hypothetical protein
MEICADCPFARITNRRYNKPNEGYCTIFRDFYLTDTPISFKENMYYPYNYRKDLSDKANGSNFSDIPFDCQYDFSNIEDI